MMVKSAIKDYGIDALLFSSSDRRWNQRQLDYVEGQFRRVSKEVKIIASCSGEDATKGIGHFPGGTTNILLGRVARTSSITYEHKDPLGRWSAFRLEGGKNNAFHNYS